MQISTETERKYDVPAGFVLPDLPGAGGGATHELDATYFDTADLRLAQHQRTLRRRTGGGDAGWHLKTPGDGSSRTEHRMPLGEADEVPADLLKEVRALVRDTPLRPVARLRTRRLETPVRDDKGRTRALIAQDTVTAETDGVAQTWQEVEVELTERGDAKLLDEMERLLLKAGASPASGPSKLARALGGRLDNKTPARKKTRSNPVLAYVREQREAILEHDPGVRRGDAEAVHKMRVGTRRLRSTLKTWRRSFPPEAVESLKADLKWLAGSLGEVRDGQVLEGKLLAAVEAEGDEFAPVADRVREHLEAKVRAGRAQLDQDLDGERYFRLLDAIDELIAGWDGGESKPIRRVRKELDKADRLLDEATLKGQDEPLHEARKKYKQARYAVEVFAPGAGKPGQALVKRLTELQDVLGAHQDSVVAREILHDLAGGSADGFPYGVLWARQQQVGYDTLGELPLVTQASRKRSLRSWLG
ncbi:CHAD domain-containing protein [Actinoplanes sp. NPDC049265]|uniref:CYTH and CHAD domain-containing protein n=1 Tax=Actinoplanes sp. NPDC049265 TaxID=3363902 RepID=UPI003712FC07